MLHTIQNSAMSVTVDELGAQLMRITAADGTEYLWSGDPAAPPTCSPTWAASPETATPSMGSPTR